MELYIFGAGASAAEGAPATSQFFKRAWELLGPRFDASATAVWCFLEATFGVPLSSPQSFRFIPAVDEVISLVDWSIHVNQGLGSAYDLPGLQQVRRELEYLIARTLDCAVQPHALNANGPHARFASSMRQRLEKERVAILTLNYDTLLDQAMAAQGVPFDYGFERLGVDGPGLFLGKLHGSLHWARCTACDQIEVEPSFRAHLPPVASRCTCRRCGSERLQGVIISPTLLKSYQGYQLQHTWRLALDAVQQAHRISFVGYSMPPADIAIYQMLQRGILANRTGCRPFLRVINHHTPGGSSAEMRTRQQGVVDRFSSLFGAEITFDFRGFIGQV
jgi:NAD-dependent SIR2 family protein deacetylase